MFVRFLICSFMHGGQLDCANFLWLTVNSRVKLCPRLAQFVCIYLRLSSICVSIQFQINGLRISCTTPIGIISHYPPCIFGYMLSWTVVSIYCLQKLFTSIILRTRHSVIAPSPSPEWCLLTVIYIPACRNLSLLTFEKGILDLTLVSNAYIIFNHCFLLWNRNLIHNYAYISVIIQYCSRGDVNWLQLTDKGLLCHWVLRCIYSPSYVWFKWNLSLFQTTSAVNLTSNTPNIA